jgi:protein-S-isoprenylcysteine O-methyltransferase Ste14
LFLKNLLFTLVVPGTVAVYLPYLLARPLSADAPSIAVSVPLFVLGGGIYLWCVWDFAAYGRGTPAPIDAPGKLVVRGLYRHVRNPMYVGVLTVLLGWVVFAPGAWLIAHWLIMFTLFNAFVLLYEEPHLREVFGPEYDRYAAGAGRWLPRFGAFMKPPVR